eukprot:scaffold63526_cov88-Cyclotella_meneghiniana.AAC.1
MASRRCRAAGVAWLLGCFRANPARRRWHISWPLGCDGRLVHRSRHTATVKQKGVPSSISLIFDFDFGKIIFEGRGKRVVHLGARNNTIK